MVWERRPIFYHFRYSPAMGDSGFDQAATFYQSDLASRGLELATGDKQAQNESNLKRLKTRVMVKKGMASLSKMM